MSKLFFFFIFQRKNNTLC